MDFGEAIKALKEGKKVACEGWNGKERYLFLVKGECLAPAIEKCYGDGSSTPKRNVGCTIAMKTAQDTIAVGWLASQTDILSEDWQIVD